MGRVAEEQKVNPVLENNDPHYFKHGNLTIKTTHHFKENGKSFSDIMAERVVRLAHEQGIQGQSA